LNRFQGICIKLGKSLVVYLIKINLEIFNNRLLFDGIETTNSIKIADKFSKYFANIGSKLAEAIRPGATTFDCYLKNSYLNSFAMFLTDPSENINIASNFDNKMSFGVDEIPIRILKCSIHSITEPLSVIINSSMQNAVFPDVLKMAKICHIFKSGDKETIENYRPISM